MPEPKHLKVILLRHTPDPEETIALAAKLCYSKASIEDLDERISSSDQTAFIEKLMDTFGVAGDPVPKGSCANSGW